MDAVQKVGNGHPGTAMSLAPAAYLLFQKVMRHNPADPHWPGRDRFVLSCGHSSLTLYIQLYLGGWGLELEDLKALRTWGSKTPGHPEYGHTAGVETTTGPLGQGIGNAVGMAMAARRERGLLDPNAAEGASPFDHQVYAICSDGDIEEGVSAEASSIAGVQQLGNLTLIYDANRISIEDDTDIALSEDVAARYEAYGWHVQTVDWTHDETDVRRGRPGALRRDPARPTAVTDRPSFIVLRTIIAWPAPNMQNTGKSHGSALGADEVAATKKVLGFDPDADLRGARRRHRAHPRGRRPRQGGPGRVGRRLRRTGTTKPSADTGALRPDADPHPARRLGRRPADLRGRRQGRRHPQGVRRGHQRDRAGAARAVGRLGRPRRLQQHHHRGRPVVPAQGPLDQDVRRATRYAGRVLHFGIREHGMGAIMNGIAVHGGTRVFGGTFLTFSDYMRPSVRLAALMGLPVTYVWTHDSIGLGEDGPTHQPIEHLAALRAIPGLDVVRPADANETAAGLEGGPRAHRPAGRAVPEPAERADLPARRGRATADTSNVHRGGYVLLDSRRRSPTWCSSAPAPRSSSPSRRASCSPRRASRARVVSMPCREWFDEQEASYRETVIPPIVKARVSVEAGIALGWREVVGDHGRIVSIEHYGAVRRLRAHLPRVRHHRGGRRRRGRGQHRRPPGLTQASPPHPHSST